MSWLTKIEKDFKIITGDGNDFTFNWMNAKVSKEYNTTAFNYINTKGSFVDRREPQGRQYDLELYIQGDDHLTKSKEFEKSADDKRFWTISHPFYGRIAVQPTSISIDNSRYNVSKFSVSVIETLQRPSPRTEEIPEDVISNSVADLSVSSVANYAENVAVDFSDINQQKNEVTSVFNKIISFIQNNEDGEAFFNQYNDTLSNLNTANVDPGGSLDSVQKLFLTPANWEQPLASRLTLLLRSFNGLSTDTNSILDKGLNIPTNIKNTYQNFGSALICSLCLSTANPIEDDYESRSQITGYIDQINTSFDTYLTDLDTFQSGDGTDKKDFMPDAQNIRTLSALVDYTISNLFNLAFEAKQERKIILEDDTDLINLTHRVYGSQTEDSFDDNIEHLMQQNSIGLNEILELKKGREVLYYV